MNSFSGWTTESDAMELDHENTTIGELPTSAVGQPAPDSTCRHLKNSRGCDAGSSFHSHPVGHWPKWKTTQSLDVETQTDTRHPPGQIETTHGYEMRHEPVMTCVGHSFPTCQSSSTAPPKAYWLHNHPGPIQMGCPPPFLSSFEPGLYNEQSSSPGDDFAPAFPGMDSLDFDGQERSSPFKDPWSGHQEGFSELIESAPKQSGHTSAGVAKTSSLLDVGSDGAPWYQESSTSPGNNMEVFTLNPEVNTVGHARPLPEPRPNALVRLRTERRPSHAYPPRQGTGYDPSRCNGCRMTDYIIASAPVRSTYHTSDASSLSNFQNYGSHTDFGASGLACSPSRSSAPASLPLDSMFSSRRASTSALPSTISDLPGNLECTWDSSMNRIEPRKRRPFSATERAETRTVRAKGACRKCKKSKRRVNLSAPYFVAELKGTTVFTCPRFTSKPRKAAERSSDTEWD